MVILVAATTDCGLLADSWGFCKWLIENAYLRFDLAGQGIPAGAVVASATLTMTVYRENACSGTPNDFLEVRPLTQAWTGSGDRTFVAHPTLPAGSGEVAAMPDSGSGDINVLPTSQPVTVDMTDTAVVQAWGDGGTNNGFALVCSYAANVMDLIMFSEEETTVAYRPKLSVTYTTDTNLVPTALVHRPIIKGSKEGAPVPPWHSFPL